MLADDRVHCDACAALTASGCARPRQANVSLSLAEREDPPHRCVTFQPKPDAVDPRAGAVRWPGLTDALLLIPATAESIGTRRTRR